MPYPAHKLFVFGGTIGSGLDSEIWQCGIRCTSSSTWTASQIDAWLSDHKASMASWFNTPSNRLRSDATLTYLKLNEIGPDGKYADTTRSHTAVVSSVGGTSPTHPSFVTVAWSWRGAFTRGPAANGRIFPPAAMLTATAGGTRLTSTDTAAHAAAAKRLIQLLQVSGASVDILTPAIVSPRAGGVATGISSVRIGDVLDTQRRRKDALREQYTTLAI